MVGGGNLTYLLRTERIQLKPNKKISYLCHLSKNLYNEANFLIRQTYFTNGKNSVKVVPPEIWQSTVSLQNSHLLISPGQISLSPGM